VVTNTIDSSCAIVVSSFIKDRFEIAEDGAGETSTGTLTSARIRAGETSLIGALRLARGFALDSVRDLDFDFVVPDAPQLLAKPLDPLRSEAHTPQEPLPLQYLHLLQSVQMSQKSSPVHAPCSFTCFPLHRRIVVAFCTTVSTGRMTKISQMNGKSKLPKKILHDASIGE
jgi:hypothetical protein